MSDPLSTLTATKASPAEPATFIFADIAGFTALTEAHASVLAAAEDVVGLVEHRGVED